MQVDVIFCDQVRIENNGKHMLVGVYPHDVMTVTQVPGAILVSAWIKVQDLPMGDYDFEMTFLSPQVPLSPPPYFGRVHVSNPSAATIMFSGPANIPLSEEGVVSVLLKMTGAANEIVVDQVAGRLSVIKISNR